MIVDTIECLQRYLGLNPLFPEVARFINENPLATLEPGHYEICGDDLFVNIVDARPKTADEARLETHDKMIDIQIPISSCEVHGWTPRSALPAAEYSETDDISFYEGQAQTYQTLMPGQFAIYFPSDAHAPAITTTTLRKAIFKVRA